MVVFVAISIYLYSQRDRFEEYLVEFVNQSNTGTMILGDAQFSPFANFPKVSIRIKELAYYEKDYSQEVTAILRIDPS